MQRREFLAALAATVVIPLAPTWAEVPAGGRYLSPRGDSSGNFFLTGFDTSGRVLFDTPLPERGHGIALRPGGAEVVQVARRPGRYLLVVEAASGRVRHRLESAAQRHFYGHAVFSPDGRWLYTPENDYPNGRGVIGVRDADDGYRQVNELPSHGVGPHDLVLLGDGRTLAVANGGIRTRPDIPRAKLNLATMSPSLAYVDRETGELRERQQLPRKWHQSSIRHLAASADDRVCFVMQHQGPRSERPPLVGIHRRGAAPILCRAPEPIRQRMRNYCGSVCIDPGGRWFATSSPRGGLVTFWDARSGAYAGHTDLADGCGLAPGTTAGEFILSSGQGAMVRYRLPEGRREPIGPLPGLDARWDNHMGRLV